MRLVAAGDDDRPRVEGLLREADLPTDDLDESPVRLFAAYADGEFVGAGGLETYGPDALLRSVAVPEPARGRGHGTAICRALESRALSAGVERLYLLTEDAEGFFAGLGFDVVERGEAPDAIRGTAEFGELCSASATCMRKALG